jgi:hypothetical protein
VVDGSFGDAGLVPDVLKRGPVDALIGKTDLCSGDNFLLPLLEYSSLTLGAMPVLS